MLAGVASLAVRDLLRGPRRAGKVLAARPHAIYLEFTDIGSEPRVIALSPSHAIRLPNAIITGPFQAREAAECWAGEGRVAACGLDVRIVRWWDPSPVFGPVSRVRLDHGCGVLARLRKAAEQPPAPAGYEGPAQLAGHDGPARLAACCASGDLAGAVEAVEQLVGLGPGLIPSGDSVVSGVLLALRLLGGAISGGTRAVWLANWLSASATSYAAQRTTTLAASLLHCAGRRPGGGGGIRRAARDGRPGAARARGGPAALGGPGTRPGLGPGGRLPGRAGAVRILTR